MTFDKTWEQLENKYPALRDPDSFATFKVRNLKALLQQLYVRGQKSTSSTPPQDGVDGAFSKLRATRDSLREEIDRRRREIDDFDKAEAARMDRIKRHEALELLDEFLQGKITHYVLLNYVPPKIIAFVDSDPDDRTEIQLLRLLGSPDGKVVWKLDEFTEAVNALSNGVTWHDQSVRPCTSWSQAVDVVRPIFAKHETAALDPEAATVPSREWLERAIEYRLLMSREYLATVERLEDKARRAEISELTARIAKLTGLS